MKCRQILFSGHAISRMFERIITKADVIHAIEQGETIASYPDDTPYPSCLLLKWIDDRPLHVVVAVNQSDKTCYIVTTYVPDATRWSRDFRKRLN